MDLIDEVIGYAKANAEAARTADDRRTWEAHQRNCIAVKAVIERLRAALKPFADYADKRHLVPGSVVITNGSTLAKGQLTMADCYHAAEALLQLRQSGNREG